MKPVTFPYGKIEEEAKSYGKTVSYKIISNLITFDNVAFALLFFLFGRAKLMGAMMPFGIAVYAAASDLKTNKFLLLFFIAAGMVSKGNVQYIYMTVSSILLFSMVIIPFNKAGKVKSFKYALVSAICNLIPEMVIVCMQGFLLYDILITAFHMIIVFSLVFILRKAFLMLSRSNSAYIFSNEEALCIVIAAAIALTGLTGMQLFGISIKTIACISIVLLSGYRGGPSMGAAVGVTVGFIIVMSSYQPPVLMGIYGICGLLAGVFNTIGKFASGIAFLAGNFLLTLYINGSTESIIYFKEIVLCIVIFLIIPESLMNKLASKFARVGIDNEGVLYSSRIKEITVERLNKFSKAFLELSKTFGEISETSIITDKNDISALFDRVADKICRDCSLCGHCWERNFYDTYQVMFKIVETLDSKGRIDQEDISAGFIERCGRINDFVDAVNNVYELFKVDMVWKNRLGESRGLVSQQLNGLSRVISNLASDIAIDAKFKNELERRLIGELGRNNIYIDNVYVTENKLGKYEIEIKHKGCGYKRDCVNNMTNVLSNITGRKMARDGHDCFMNGRTGYCEVRFIEEERFNVTTGVARMSKHGSMVSGDSYSFMKAGNGKYLVALSDGMGSGQKAASQSKAAISLLEQFMDAGFDKDTAINLINSILVLKSSEESFTTIDLTVIDLYDSDAEFLKIGAVTTFIKRQEKVEAVRSVSLPAGIFSNINTELIHKKIDSGDFIIMMTDGIIDAFKREGQGENALKEFIESIKTINPQEIADTIIDKAYRLSDGMPGDDMTIIVAKVWKKYN